MKFSLVPKSLPKGLDWRWTNWLLLAGLLLTLRAAAGGRLHEKPEAIMAWIGSGLLLFVVAFRGRAEHLAALVQQREAQRAESARLQTVGLATAGFLHELKNAVTVLHGYAELAKRATDPEKTRELVADLDAQAARLAATLKGYLDLASETPRPRRLLGATFEETARLVAPLARLRELTFESSAADGIDRLVADPAFREALLNLGLNAVAFAKSRVGFRLQLDGETPIVIVEDDGPGVPASQEATLFTAMTSSRPGGHGLGLAQVRSAIEQEGGTLHHEAVASGGARFVVRLPAALRLGPA